MHSACLSTRYTAAYPRATHSSHSITTKDINTGAAGVATIFQLSLVVSLCMYRSCANHLYHTGLGVAGAAVLPVAGKGTGRRAGTGMHPDLVEEYASHAHSGYAHSK